MKAVVLLPSFAAGLLFGLAPLAQSAEEPDGSRADQNWWAFQEIEEAPPLPEPAGQDGDHPIDAFIAARLSEHDMIPAPLADPEVLIKRLHYDLTGLPPSPSDIQAFVAQCHLHGHQAYLQLVDRLLGSPSFGERWGRHWLDVVRFAETNGYERDAVKPHFWKYRDWVIEAFNRDLPFNVFVRDQLAGDEISERTTASVIATGMLRAGTWNDEPNDPQVYKYERLEDMVDVVGTAFLGLTVKCARCHDHKFDPIPQRDYYRFAAAFWAGPIEPRGPRELMGGPTEAELGVAQVFGWTDLDSKTRDFHLLIKGDPARPSAVVQPGHLSLVPWLDAPLQPPADGSKTSKRRLQMAQFITSERNPLTARVIVNRIWQKVFGEGLVRTPNNFGFKSSPPSHPQLLDRLAADFMEGGWSVKRLIRQLLIARTYRQASTHPQESKYAEIDSGNALLWKMPRRRKDAEVLRDHLLHASGFLDRRAGGPSFYPVLAPAVLEGFSRKEAAWTPSPQAERQRRSVYMMSKRHLLLPLMTAFDFPNSEKPCGQRDVTTVPPQALALLNNEFVHRCSESLSGSLLQTDLPLADTVGEAWQTVLLRAPQLAERRQAVDHFRAQASHFNRAGHPTSEAEKHALASLVHVLMNTNEFAYVD